MIDLKSVVAFIEANTDGVEYQERQKRVVDNIGLFEGKIVIRDEQDYRLARLIRSVVSSAWCFAATGSAEFDRIHEISKAWDQALRKYNQALLLKKDSFDKALAKYLLWNKMFTGVDVLEVLKYAVMRDLLRKGVNGDFYVIGLQYKVGDNVFKVDSKGRESRIYVDTIGRQAIEVSDYYSRIIKELSLEDQLPQLCDTYYPTGIGDNKGGIRTVTLTRPEKVKIFNHFS